jgi:hypothetical protein
MVDREDRERIQALEEREVQRDREVAELSSTVSRLAATLEALRASKPLPWRAAPSHGAPPAPSVTASKAPKAPSAAALGPPPSDPPPSPLPLSCIPNLTPVLLSGSVVIPPPPPSPSSIPDFRAMYPVPPGPPPRRAPPPAPSAVALRPAPTGFASLIVADFPALFAEFGGKRFALLWRGSGNGFRARGFHGRCHGHAPTLTLIQDTEGSIFGGFTPLEWSSSRSRKSRFTRRVFFLR